MSAFIAGKLIQTVGTILRWLTLFVVSKFKGVSSPKYDEVSHGFESEDEYQKVVRRWGNYGFGLFFFAVLLLIYHFIYLT